MILEIFIVLMGLSFILIYLGYRFEAIALKVIGFGFVFVVGVATLGGGFEYHDGDNVTDLGGGDKLIEMQYDTYTSRTISLFLCVIGVVGSTLLIWDEKKSRQGF